MNRTALALSPASRRSPPRRCPPRLGQRKLHHRPRCTRGLIWALALLAVLAPVAGGHATTAASAAPANKPSADRWVSESANAGYVAFSARSPTLTGDIRQPRDVAEWQLPVGVALLAGGLLGLVYGLVTLLLPRRRTIARAVYGDFWSRA